MIEFSPLQVMALEGGKMSVFGDCYEWGLCALAVLLVGLFLAAVFF